MKWDFNLAQDCEGELLPNSANRYNVAEPQLMVLILFSILTVNMLWLWLIPPRTHPGMNLHCESSGGKSSREDTNYTKGHEF